MTHDELRQLLVAPEMVVVDLLGHCLDALRPVSYTHLAVPMRNELQHQYSQRGSSRQLEL